MDRLFLACQARLDDYPQLQEAFSGLIKGKWTPPERLHMTLYYFGNAVEPEELLRRLEAFDFSFKAPIPLERLGYFKHNHILYASARPAPFEKLYAALQSEFGLSRHSEFVAHVTLMRIKAFQDVSSFYETLHSFDDTPLGTLSPSVALLNSRIDEEGVRYELVRRLS